MGQRAGKSGWRAVQAHSDRAPDALPGETYELHGNHIVDEVSFYCAIGEVVNGPAGYFGSNLAALDDCLCGGFGAKVPFTLIWHDSDVARECLARPLEWEERQVTLFETISTIFEEHGVEVVLR
ncbi:barstar family protein [Streptosporangium sp. NPDC000396]|uniref:barstar family protein n=1 Tax=Streptosporangium sp. NPDC000396 TaxID=3366185 RepID=UPI003691522D